MRSIKRIIIHHSVTSSMATVEEIRQIHLAKGYGKLGYNFMVNGDGKILYGCPVLEAGVHCKGFNTDSIGVCILGNFMIETPTSFQYWGLRKLVKSLVITFNNIPILAHRDLAETLCPGNNLYSILPRIKKELEISSEDLL